jgi:hypothetical protein
MPRGDPKATVWEEYECWRAWGFSRFSGVADSSSVTGDGERMIAVSPRRVPQGLVENRIR